MPTATNSGASGRVIAFKNKTLYLNKWSVSETAVDIKTTHFESVGSDGLTYEDGILGPIVADVEFSGFFDTFNVPESLNLKIGTIITDVSCYLHKDSATLFYGFPYLRVLNVSVSAGVEDGEIKFSLKGKSKGEYTRPS